MTASLTIAVARDAARVPLAARDLVEPLVSARTRTFAPAAGGAVTGRVTRVSAGRAEGDEFLFPAKLAPAVGATLHGRGVDARLVYAGGLRLPTPDPEVLAAAPEAVRTLLGTPLGRAGRLIHHGPGAHPFALVPALLACYRRFRVALAVPGRRQVRGWVHALWLDALRRAGPYPRVVTDEDLRSRWGAGPKVLVTTLRRLEHCRDEDWDVVVAPDARPLRHADPRVPGRTPAAGPPEHVAKLAHVPAFGFLPAGPPLSGREELALHAQFGPGVVLGGSAAGRVVVRAEPDPTPVPPGVPEPDRDAAGYQRQAVWVNTPRTEWVAALAHRAAADEPAARVLVLAEYPHAWALGQFLRWPVLRGVSDRVHPRAVVTPGWAVRQRPLPADVVVDARGWGPLTLRGFPPRGAAGVTLIDAGGAGPAGERLTRQRLDEYEARGWVVDE